MRTILCALALASVAFATSASAQVRFLPYVGYSFGGGYDFEEFEMAGPGDDIPGAGGFLVGVGAEFSVTPAFLPIALKIRPSAETVFLPGHEGDIILASQSGGGTFEASQSLTQVNLDLIADFSPPMAPLAIFGGVGAAYAMYNGEITVDFGGDTETQDADDSALGLNLSAGARFGGGFVQPFVQGRYTLMTLQPGEDDLSEGEEFPEEAEINRGFSILAGVSIGL